METIVLVQFFKTLTCHFFENYYLTVNFMETLVLVQCFGNFILSLFFGNCYLAAGYFLTFSGPVVIRPASHFLTLFSRFCFFPIASCVLFLFQKSNYSFCMCFGIRILGPFHLETQSIPKLDKNCCGTFF